MGASEDASAARFERIVRVVGAIVAPITVLTALMFYFGWVYTNALFQHFGIEAPVLEFSNQDYILRNAQALYIPIDTPACSRTCKPMGTRISSENVNRPAR